MPMVRSNMAMDGHIMDESVEYEAAGSAKAALPEPTPSAPEKESTEEGPEPRTNFNETAFFYPDLKTNEEGNVEFSFEVPDALTKWKMQLLALSPTLQYGQAEEVLVTSKELMVVPNYPRFLIAGDTILFSSRIAIIVLFSSLK